MLKIKIQLKIRKKILVPSVVRNKKQTYLQKVQQNDYKRANDKGRIITMIRYEVHSTDRSDTLPFKKVGR